MIAPVQYVQLKYFMSSLAKVNYVYFIVEVFLSVFYYGSQDSLVGTCQVREIPKHDIRGRFFPALKNCELTDVLMKRQSPTHVLHISAGQHFSPRAIFLSVID